MHTRRSLLRLAAAAGVLAMLAAGCASGTPQTRGTTPPVFDQTPDVTLPSPPPPPPAPTTVDSIRFSVTAAERNLTPWTQGTGYPGYYMMTLIYDTLLWLDADGQPQPWLAREFEVSDDGLTWTFTLHDGVTFHDGEPLTSADVAFTIDYLKEHPRPRFTPVIAPITEVQTPDDTTVIMTLAEPQAGFVRRPLADLPIIPEHIWSGIDDPDSVVEDLPVGSGPYRLVEYVPEQVWRFEANADYFLGEPVAREIVMPFIANDQAAIAAVRSGDADATSASLTPELAEDVAATPGVELIRGPGFRGWYLYINTARTPWDNVELRQALLNAIDVGEIVDVALLGSGTPGSPGFVHRELPWANPDTVEQTRDLDRANELLDGLGFTDTDGDGVREVDGEPLAAEIIVDSDDAVAIRAVELIAEDAAEAGITLEALALDPQTAGQRIWPDTPVGRFQGDYTLGNHSWAAIVQLDFTFLRSLFHSDTEVGTINRSAYSNPEYDALADELVRTVDEQAQRDLLFQLQEIIATDVPAIALYFPEDIIPIRTDAFGGWQYYTGVGILNKAAFLP